MTFTVDFETESKRYSLRQGTRKSYKDLEVEDDDIYVCKYQATFKILVVRAPRDNRKSRRTTKNTDAVVRKFWHPSCKPQLQPLLFTLFHVWTTKNLDRQLEIVTWLSMGQPFIFP